MVKKAIAEEKFYGTGRRKTAVAKVWLKPGKGTININGRDYKAYIVNRQLLENMILRPLQVTELLGKIDVRVSALGGGVASQAAAVSLGVARALLEYNPDFKNILRANGLLTRDARAKERKKYGRKLGSRSDERWLYF